MEPTTKGLFGYRSVSAGVAGSVAWVRHAIKDPAQITKHLPIDDDGGGLIVFGAKSDLAFLGWIFLAGH